MNPMFSPLIILLLLLLDRDLPVVLQAHSLPSPDFQERGNQFLGRIAARRRATSSARARQLTSQASRGENLPELSGGPSSNIKLRRRIMQVSGVWSGAQKPLSAGRSASPAGLFILRAERLPEFPGVSRFLVSCFSESVPVPNFPPIYAMPSGTACNRNPGSLRANFPALIQGADGNR